MIISDFLPCTAIVQNWKPFDLGCRLKHGACGDERHTRELLLTCFNQRRVLLGTLIHRVDHDVDLLNPPDWREASPMAKHCH